MGARQDGLVAEVGRTNRDRVFVVRLEKRGLQTAWNRPRRARSSLEGTCVGRRHRPRGGSSKRTGSGAWVSGMNFPKPSCFAGSNPHTKLDLHPFPKAMKPRHDRRRFGATESRALYRARGESSWWSRSTRRHARVARRGVCAKRSAVFNGAVRTCPNCDMKRQRSGSIRDKARPAHHQARGGSAGERAILNQGNQGSRAPSSRH